MKELESKFYDLVSGGTDTLCFCTFNRSPLKKFDYALSQEQCAKHCCQQDALV